MIRCPTTWRRQHWPQRVLANDVIVCINPFTADPLKGFTLCILVWPTIFNFWHSGALALRIGRQSARMSKIKNGGLDQYGVEPFEQQQFGAAGVKGLKRLW